MNKIIKYTTAVLAGTLLWSCNTFLDEIPDSRTELDSDEKIAELLVNAYPDRLFSAITEHMSDNIDYMGVNASDVHNRIQEQAFRWEDVIEGSLWDDPRVFWEYSYRAIAHANLALQAIEEEGNPTRLDPQRGEALLCRAFAHFYLANLFCMAYHPSTASTNLGIPYTEVAETTVSPHYERGTLEEVYTKIERDMLAGMELIDDNAYLTPKYHFNKQAANAFAARYYQYRGKEGDYEKVITYATRVLGSEPREVLMDYPGIASVTAEFGPLSRWIASADRKANLMLLTPVSQGMIYGGPFIDSGKRYAQTSMLAESEGCMSAGLWGAYATTTFWNRALTYTECISKPDFPYYFYVTNVVAQIGEARTAYRIFTTNETLLARAEAYIMLGDFDKAADDLSLWIENSTRSGIRVSRSQINDYYDNLEYYNWRSGTPKKRLNMVPAIVEGSEQENFLHCLLHLRRIEYSYNGMRWFDIKRFGIEVTHRELNANYDPIVDMGTLTHDDLRRAIQIPSDVISAGLKPNPR